MEGLNINNPVRVKAIYFKTDPCVLVDRIAWITETFLIVALDENDTAPTWYCMDGVEKLEGVEPLEPKRAGRITIF